MKKSFKKNDNKSNWLLGGIVLIVAFMVIAPLATGYTMNNTNDLEQKKINLLESTIEMAIAEERLVIDNNLDKTQLGKVLKMYLVEVPESSNENLKFVYNPTLKVVSAKYEIKDYEILILP